MQNENKKVPANKTGEVKKSNTNRKDNKKEKKINEDTHLTYTMADRLDQLFPQFKPSKKKEEVKE